MASDTGFTSVPYWITPGNIFIIGNGNITLKWEPPSYLAPLTLLSIFMLLYTTYRTFKQKAL
jgi:hypothetical protein